MGAQQTVLVVEDEPIIRFAIADTLRDAGYQVLEAANGDEACHTLEMGLRVDLVVTDINMPGTLDVPHAHRSYKNQESCAPGFCRFVTPA